MAVGIVGIIDLVSDAPEDDGRMVSVAKHHGGQILFMPLREVLKVALVSGRINVVARGPLVLGVFPFVKGLVHHQEAQSVAQVIQLRHMRVVAGADGVAAHFLQGKQTPFPYLAGHSRAETARVVVDAYALQLHAASVQEEALVRIETEGTDADGALVYPVRSRSVHGKLRHQRIKRRIFRRPQPGIGYASA